MCQISNTLRWDQAQDIWKDKQTDDSKTETYKLINHIGTTVKLYLSLAEPNLCLTLLRPAFKNPYSINLILHTQKTYGVLDSNCVILVLFVMDSGTTFEKCIYLIDIHKLLENSLTQ